MTDTDRTPIVTPLVVAAVGILLTLGLALGGTVAPGNALQVALGGGVIAVMVAMAATCVLHRSRVAALDAELTAIRGHAGAARERDATLAESRRELVAWVSDDLRTPLASLRATAEALEDGIIDEPAQVAAALASMSEEIDRLADLLSDLYEISHQAEGSVATDIALAAPVLREADVSGEDRRFAGPADRLPAITPGCAFDLAFRARPVHPIGPLSEGIDPEMDALR